MSQRLVKSKILTKVSWFWLLGLAVSLTSSLVFASGLWGYSVDKTDLPSEYESYSILSFNVGNAGENLWSATFGQHCYLYKLCREPSVKAAREYLKMIDADVLLLQEVYEYDQLFGSKHFGPLLDASKYQGQCDTYTCIAWKRSKFRVAEGRVCKIMDVANSERSLGSFVNCPLRALNGRRVVQYVSVHYPAVTVFKQPMSENQVARHKLSEGLFYGVGDYVDPWSDMVVGGDFNTNSCINSRDCSVPYPPNFYTLYGKHLKGYGAYQDLLDGVVPLHTFNGAYELGRPKSYSTHMMYGLRNALDHVFANLGVPVDDPSDRLCPYSACLAGIRTLPLPTEIDGPFNFDHRAVLTRIAYKP